MEQLQKGFSDSTPKAGSDRYKKDDFVHYNSYPLVKLAPTSVCQVISTLFKLGENFVQ